MPNRRLRQPKFLEKVFGCRSVFYFILYVPHCPLRHRDCILCSSHTPFLLRSQIKDSYSFVISSTLVSLGLPGLQASS